MRAVWYYFSLLLFLSVALFGQDVRVTATSQVLESAGRVSWGAQNNLLALDRVNAAGFYDVYTSNPDGSNPVCLTCNAAQFPYNKGNPEWHPSNNFLAIQIEWSVPFLDASSASPGAGVDNDLYIMDAVGENYWPVTQNAKGVLHPRFSHSGNQLLWVQRTIANNWNLMLADFAVVNNVPQVTNIQSLPPCASGVFCETGGFSADDSTVFFTHSTSNGSTVYDIYSYNLSTQVTTNLTNSVSNWNEFPTAFPSNLSNNRILWMSGVFTPQGLETDYWMMNYDGSDQVQVTYYNDAAAPNWYLGSVSSAKFSWGPGGAQIASYLIPDGTGNGQPGNIDILSLAPGAPTLSAASFSRPPVSGDSIVSTFYPNLATGSASTPSTSLPDSLSGASVLVTDARNTVRQAPLFFVSPGQINWEIPSGTAPGPAAIQFTSAAGVVSGSTINVQASGPGLFTANATGSGPPAAYLLTSPEATPQFTFTCEGATCVPAPLNLGSTSDSTYLILFGTGLRHAAAVSANLLGQTLPVSFYGAQGTYPGLDQINVQLPSSLTGSGLVALTIVADQVSSNAVQLLIQ